MKNRIDLKKFENIIDKEISYILGLLWADGHVTFANNKSKTPIIKHTTKPEDNDTYLPIFQYSGNWNTFTAKNIGSYSKTPKNIVINWVSCRELGQYLIDHDFRNKTNSPDLILNKIPNNLRVYWYRGFFDGDGSVSIKHKGHHSVTFTSSSNQDWSFIVNLYKELNIERFKHRIVKSRGGSSSQIRITNKKDIIKFERYLYDDYDNYPLGLSRKRDKFFEL